MPIGRCDGPNCDTVLRGEVKVIQLESGVVTNYFCSEECRNEHMKENEISHLEVEKDTHIV